MKNIQLLQRGAILPLLFCVCLNFAVAQQPGATFSDCAECPQMVVIPGGDFLMGTPEIAQNASRASEGPQHQVKIEAFALGKFEVTQAEWTAVMGDDPSSNKGAGLPVEGVSWNAANAFVEKLSAKTGKAYRLPTEAEWEYAARAGSTTAYAFGDDEALLSEHAWFDGNSGMATHPVGEKPANKFGLHDMHGNVWEWVQDCFHENYIGVVADGRKAEEHPTCDRVSRGGSWYDVPEVARSAYRFKDGPNNSVSGMGLRVVRAVP